MKQEQENAQDNGGATQSIEIIKLLEIRDREITALDGMR